MTVSDLVLGAAAFWIKIWYELLKYNIKNVKGNYYGE